MVPSFLLDSMVLFVGFMFSDLIDDSHSLLFAESMVCKVVIYVFVTKLPNLPMNHVLFIPLYFAVWFSGLVNVFGIS